jgi:hypothetical protein
MPVTPAQRNAAIAGFLTIAVLVAYQVMRPSADGLMRVDDNGHHLVIFFDGGTPPGAVCLESDVWASTAALQSFSLDGDAGSYGHVFIATLPGDAGEAEQGLPAGYFAFDNDQQVVGCGDAGVWFQFWDQRGTAPPFRCACGTGCSRPDGMPVVPGLTYGPGTWSPGDGGVCLPKTCTELGGISSMPEACR